MGTLAFKVPTPGIEAEALANLFCQSFVVPLTTETTAIRRHGINNFRSLWSADQLVGGLGIIPQAQWFGGKAVPMAGIGSVAIAPEWRGQGHASELMKLTLTELQEQGVALSMLYPASQPLYRKVGYEQAGYQCLWAIAPDSLPWQRPTLAIHPLTTEPTALIKILTPLYNQQAQRYNGLLQRAPGIWQQLVTGSQAASLHAYGFGPREALEGYILFEQQRLSDQAVLRIRDWALLTPQSVQNFWAFLAQQQTMITKITWQSSPLDWLSVCLPHQTAHLQSQRRWFLRIVNVAAALEARGYPELPEQELHFEIYDPLLVANQGRYILELAMGQAQVRLGGRGDLKLAIDALAPLYTGYLSAEVLQRLGKLEATTAIAQQATQIFQGSVPWAPDFF